MVLVNSTLVERTIDTNFNSIHAFVILFLPLPICCIVILISEEFEKIISFEITTYKIISPITDKK
jgi:hypothetical protein